ncbi:GGDEF domain-containing protein [Megalodesulfovibrio paquesii]
MLESLHIPTIFVMIILASLAQAFSVGWVVWNDDRDGLRTWAIALCFHAAGYGLFALRGVIWDFSSIVVANVCIALAYSSFLKAIHIFTGRPLSPVPQWLPAVVIAITFSLSLESIRPRMLIGNSIFCLQNALVIVALASQRFTFRSLGRNLMLFGLVLTMAVTLWRTGAALLHPVEVDALFKVSPVQVVTYLSSFVSILFVSNGYYLMAKARSDEQLLTAAMQDRLTGCWNRVHTEAVARQEVARLNRYGYPVTLMMIDLDHFKTVNDQHGHTTGDAVLRQFGKVLRRVIRATDVAGRWGGEEFVVILPSSGLFETLQMADVRQRLLLSQPARAFITSCCGMDYARHGVCSVSHPLFRLSDPVCRQGCVLW